MTKDEGKAEAFSAIFVPVFKNCCSLGTQPLELKDRDREQKEVPIIQGKWLVTCYTT